MKRVIKASHLEDIRRKKAEYQKERDAWEERHDIASRNYSLARKKALQPLTDAITSDLRKFIEPLKLDIDVDFIDCVSTEDNKDFPVEIKIQSNRGHDNNIALSWDYSVKINTKGEVESETNSWSGLQATTVSQINTLKLTAECLDVLAHENWKSLLLVDRPSYYDYHDKNDHRPEYQITKADEAQAVFDDIEGTDYAVRLLSTNDDDRWASTDRYIKIIKQTDSQIYPELFYKTRDGKFRQAYIGDRKKKSSVSINPDDIIEITENDIVK